jgi:hypothetical protein
MLASTRTTHILASATGQYRELHLSEGLAGLPESSSLQALLVSCQDASHRLRWSSHRWGHRKPGYHCWRNAKSAENYASSRESGVLAVSRSSKFWGVCSWQDCSILLFYILSILVIGLNGKQRFKQIVPWYWAHCSTMGLPKSLQCKYNHITIHYCVEPSGIEYASLLFNIFWLTSLIHLIAVAASFMNTVILTSVLSAGNHALFAGTRVLYSEFWAIVSVPHSRPYHIS